MLRPGLYCVTAAPARRRVTLPPALTGVHAVLLDVEGTVTPVAFVYNTLFPYARAHMHEFLDEAGATNEVRSAIDVLAAEHRADDASGAVPPPWRDPSTSVIAGYALWLMERDRKSPGLKTLQGLLWARAYDRGELRGELFPDVAPAFVRWRSAGIRIAIYSSGSVLAQRLIFSTAPDGDLTPMISRYFDTAVGPKAAPESYRTIAAAIAMPPAAILFVSDVTAELSAACEAGLQVALAVRPGNAPAAPMPGVPAVVSLDSLS